MKDLRVLLAIRDPVVAEMLHRLLEGSGAVLLGRIDPGIRADFLNRPTLADVVLVKAEEIVALKGRRWSMVERLHHTISLLALVHQDDLAGLADLPARVDGLIFLGKDENLLLTQIQLALEGHCLLPSDCVAPPAFAGSAWATSRTGIERADGAARPPLQTPHRGATRPRGPER